MKHCLLFISALIISIASVAQSTWTQRLNYSDNSTYEYNDSLTGINEIEFSKDGDLYVLASIDQDDDEYLFKISPDDSAINWSVQVGFTGGITAGYTNNIYPTADSGCVISNNFWNADDAASRGTIEKYAKDGQLQWSHVFYPHGLTGSPPYYDMEAYYVLENSFYKSYYVFVGDSLYELNDSGNVVSKIDTAVSNIYPKPNGDLIFQTSNGVYCTDTSGNIHWSLPGDTVLSVFSSYIFVTTGQNYQKINNSNGSVIWSLPSWSMPFSGISSLDYIPNGGVIGSCGCRPWGMGGGFANPMAGTLFKIDSSGTVLWSKTFDFPEFGLSFVKQSPSGNIITGGAFIFTNSDHELFAHDYSAFVASLDSAGNGRLQTTTLMWPGDANNNQYLSFVDDALYVMVAMGNSGPKRDTLNTRPHCPYALYECGLWSDYGSDWSNSGLNYKYADFNGDGVIDTNDLVLYPYIWPTDIGLQGWRKSNPFNRVASNPDFSLVTQYDSIPAGDSINFFIIAGSAAVPVDSIYGIAFSVTAYFPSDTLCVNEPKVTFKNSSLGTIGTDVYTYSYQNATSYCLNNNALISRTDHNNVYNLNDTLGLITLYTTTSHVNDNLVLYILEFNALTAGGSVVSFNLSNGSVFVYGIPQAVNELNKEYLKVFPNPSNHFLTVSIATVSNKKFVVYNYLGKMVKEFESPDALVSIQTDDLANGVYQLMVTSEGWSKNVAFVVEH